MRRNFIKAVRVEIVKRAMRSVGSPDGVPTMQCEKCQLPCRRFEIHHLVMDAMETDKSRKLTAADGALWCVPCHKEETRAQAPILAKARDTEAYHLGARAASPRGFKKAPRVKEPSRHAQLPKRSVYADR